MIKRYRERKYIEAIQFTNTQENIQAIIGFVGVPIYVEYTTKGIQMRIVRDPFKAIIVQVGECITKEEDGTLGVCTPEHLAENYDEEIE